MNRMILVYTSNYVLRTHLGKALEVVIGKTKEVQELDRKHHQLKLLQKEKNQNKDYIYTPGGQI